MAFYDSNNDSTKWLSAFTSKSFILHSRVPIYINYIANKSSKMYCVEYLRVEKCRLFFFIFISLVKRKHLNGVRKKSYGEKR